jgi:hypothetical protein
VAVAMEVDEGRSHRESGVSGSGARSRESVRSGGRIWGRATLGF